MAVPAVGVRAAALEFVPPKPIRELRDLTWYRKSLIQERAREANRLHKVLEDAGVKLSCVATDVLDVSGRLMLEALVSGTRDPEVLADLARGALRKKLPALREALAGDFKAHHALIVSHILAHIDYLDEAIATLTSEVEQRLVPFAHKAQLLATIDGVAARTAHVILAELGPDMSRFPTDRHAASWTAICPGNHESAGKRKSGRPRNGNPHLQATLIEAANAAIRTKNTYLRAQYEQFKRRRGHKRAIVAVAHSILIECATSSKTTSPTKTSAATTSRAAPTPNDSPNASWRSSNGSGTRSRYKRQRQTAQQQPERDFLSRRTDRE